MKDLLWYGHRNDWTRAEITYELKRRGTNIEKLSREAGLADKTLRNALEKKWPKGEKIIADAIGVRPEAIWPSRYKNSSVNVKK